MVTTHPATEGAALASATPSGRGDPCVMVIFGATGDLTKRKLIPALYNLEVSDLLSPHFAVVGLGRTPWTTEEFRRRMTTGWESSPRSRSTPRAGRASSGASTTSPAISRTSRPTSACATF